jgi:hypothetical protein
VLTIRPRRSVLFSRFLEIGEFYANVRNITRVLRTSITFIRNFLSVDYLYTLEIYLRVLVMVPQNEVEVNGTQTWQYSDNTSGVYF